MIDAMTSAFDLNFRHLACVTAIARLGSISAAADAVHLSQPAITQGVAKLERIVGVRLFDRQPTGMTPTAEGEQLLARIERMAAELAAGSRTLRVGTLPVERFLSATHLRAVIAVVEHGSFALAADAIGLSQPSVHRAARDLERLIGVPLLVRHGRTIRPTEAAARFVRHAKLAMAELAAGLAELGRATGNVVAIGAMPLARAVVLPRVVPALRAAFPDLTISIVEGPYGELLSGLRSGDLDLLIGALRDPPPVQDVTQEAMFEDRLIVVGRAGHPLAGTSAPSIAELAGFDWVVGRPGTPLHEHWRCLFTDAGGKPPATTVECSSIVAIRGMLMESDWLTLLSPHQIRLERRAGWLVPIGEALPRSQRTIAVTTRRDWRPTPAQARLHELVVAADDRWLSENE